MFSIFFWTIVTVTVCTSSWLPVFFLCHQLPLLSHLLTPLRGGTSRFHPVHGRPWAGPCALNSSHTVVVWPGPLPCTPEWSVSCPSMLPLNVDMKSQIDVLKLNLAQLCPLVLFVFMVATLSFLSTAGQWPLPLPWPFPIHAWPVGKSWALPSEGFCFAAPPALLTA